MGWGFTCFGFTNQNKLVSKVVNLRAYANSVDPDQTARNAPSDQGPHCLLLVSTFKHTN